MKRRDPLLGTPPTVDHEFPTSTTQRGRRRLHNKTLWISLGHVAFLAAGLVGWEHLDLFWPRSLYPEGLPLGASRHVAGLLTIGDRGRAARLTLSAGLIEDWRHWLQEDERQDSSECIALSESARTKLPGGATPRVGSGGMAQYWVDATISDRLGPSQCDRNGGVQIMHGVDRIAAIRPVPCSRDVFVAHGFVCPLDHRVAQQSETFPDTSAYYPAEALRGRKEGRAVVRVDRDETGSPIACRVTTSSGDADLDEQTCKLVGVDPAFTPAEISRTPRGVRRSITQAVR